MQSPYEPDREVTVHDMIAVVEALAQELRLADWKLVVGIAARLSSPCAARIVVDGIEVGSVGEVDADVVDALALVGPVVACELDVDALLCAGAGAAYRAPVSRYPSSAIDLAFVVSDDVPRAKCCEHCAEPAASSSSRFAVFDVFRSDALGAGKVSLAFALKFRAPDRTLTDAEVGELRQQCIDAVVSAFGAELRG